MMNKKKFLGILLTMSLSLSILEPVSATSIQGTREEVAEIRQEKAIAKEELQALENKLNDLADQMEKIEKRIDKKEDQIREKEEELVQAQITERKQYSSMKKRIRYMYENGNAQLMEIVFSSESMSDFLNNVEYVKSLSQYDRNMLNEYAETVQTVKEEKKVLKAEYKKLQDMQDELLAKEEEVQQLYAEKKDEIKLLAKQLKDTKNRLNQLIAAAREAARKKAEAEAAARAAAEAEAARQQAAAQQQQVQQQEQQEVQQDNSYVEPAPSAPATGSGSMTHPCPGGILTSPYGGRDNPTGYGYQFHKGIDLACGEGTPYYAADSGTVVIAGYSPSAGNWIVIDHGGGIQTYYMHSSAIYVSAGQTVSKGQNIGAVGTTGDSTGPHLHFQVVVNGVDTNPFNYL
ncbi:MAG: peptidoglycan DD-metalloendopeptidase family protein [Dorea sp.]|nr:peptidoglycan DD-metalloendopeptidase family protein [Dorea sp.]